MRAGVLALVVCALGCETRNGTYLVVDGSAAGLTFDRVEFFFGHYVGDEALVTPGFTGGPNNAGSTVSIGKRLVAETDVLQESSSVKTLNYYLPLSPDNERLGDYVVAIASQGDMPVGAAELVDFTIRDDAAYMYTLTLEPFPVAGLEQWGAPTRDCVRWTRMRPDDAVGKPSTYAVVRDGDFDCDGITRTADCDDLAFCPVGAAAGSFACTRAAACVTDGCEIGVCNSTATQPGQPLVRDCRPVTCVDPMACERCGLDQPSTATVQELLSCVLADQREHLEIELPVVETTKGLCETPYVVHLPLPSGVACEQPQILFPPSGKDMKGFTYTVTQSMIGGSTCDLAIQPPLPLPMEMYPSDVHLILSIAPPQVGGLRPTFTIGIAPNNNLVCNDSPVFTSPTTGVIPSACLQ